jgi:hypothetical protein
MFGITFHASDRFKERFPHLDINTELKTAVPFGKSSGKCKYYISANKVVFAVSENFCTTVLTEGQAYNNMRIDHYVPLQPVQVAEQITSKTTNIELASNLARKHARQDKANGVKPKNTEQHRLEELYSEATKINLVIGKKTLGRYNQIYIQHYLGKQHAQNLTIHQTTEKENL